MIYRDFQDKKLSALGFGTMRLPTGPNGSIDEEQVRRMTRYAIDHGVNYFATAYPYHNGNSERVIGRVLKDYPRDSYYLATKYPGHQILSGGYNPAEIFEEQLHKCDVEYFDFFCIPAGILRRNAQPPLRRPPHTQLDHTRRSGGGYGGCRRFLPRRLFRGRYDPAVRFRVGGTGKIYDQRLSRGKSHLLQRDVRYCSPLRHFLRGGPAPLAGGWPHWGESYAGISRRPRIWWLLLPEGCPRPALHRAVRGAFFAPAGGNAAAECRLPRGRKKSLSSLVSTRGIGQDTPTAQK